MIDSDDRHALGIAAVWVGGIVVAALTLAVAAGLAVRVFLEISGV